MVNFNNENAWSWWIDLLGWRLDTLQVLASTAIGESIDEPAFKRIQMRCHALSFGLALVERLGW